MKRIMTHGAAMLGAAVTVIVLAASPQSDKGSGQLHDFMRQKRDYSQVALDGLMKEDYDQIVVSAMDMGKMATDKRWQRFLTEDYQRYSEQFQIHAQAMADGARSRKLDAAMDAYIACLQTCYNCHKYVRGQTRAKPSPQ